MAIDDGWPVLALGVTGGRPGRDTTMEPASVMLAVRSIALRPDARAKLNAERDKGYRSTRQRGHEHDQVPATTARSAQTNWPPPRPTHRKGVRDATRSNARPRPSTASGWARAARRAWGIADVVHGWLT